MPRPSTERPTRVVSGGRVASTTGATWVSKAGSIVPCGGASAGKRVGWSGLGVGVRVGGGVALGRGVIDWIGRGVGLARRVGLRVAANSSSGVGIGPSGVGLPQAALARSRASRIRGRMKGARRTGTLSRQRRRRTKLLRQAL